MRKISSKFMALTVFLVIFGGIGATILADVWTTESTKVPVTYKEGEFEGQYNPQDIRGSYTFSEVSELFEVELDDLFTAFGIPEGTDGTTIQTKVLEEMYPNLPNEIGNGSVQLFVAFYKGLPAEYDDTYLPAQAKDILYRVNEKLTAEEKAYIESHLAVLPEPAGEDTVPTEAAVTEEVEPLVKGATTFQQVLDAGITKAEIEEILGSAMPATNLPIKDYCLDKGLSFSEVKDKLNALIEN
jgi:hypothetical protein